MEPSSLKISVSTAGKESSVKNVQDWTFGQLTRWIGTQNYEPEIERLLIKKASKYPTSALGNFKKNIVHHIAKIQKDVN